MSLYDEYYKHVPEYNKFMYLDGYTPEEIMYALHKKMQSEMAERQTKEDDSFINSLIIKSEVKVKR